MSVNHTQDDRTVDERLARIEAQNDAIIQALQKKKKNIVFVSQIFFDLRSMFAVTVTRLRLRK